MNHTGYDLSPRAIGEMKRQAKFAKTCYARYEAKHQASQAKLAAKIAKLEAQLAKAEELSNMEKAL